MFGFGSSKKFIVKEHSAFREDGKDSSEDFWITVKCPGGEQIRLEMNHKKCVLMPSENEWLLYCQIKGLKLNQEDYEKIKIAILQNFKNDIKFERYAPEVDNYKVQNTSISKVILHSNQEKLELFVLQVLKADSSTKTVTTEIKDVLRGDRKFIKSQLRLGVGLGVWVQFKPNDLLLVAEPAQKISQYFNTEHLYLCNEKAQISEPEYFATKLKFSIE